MAQFGEVNGSELLWYEILGEPIPRRFLDAELGAFGVAGQNAGVLVNPNIKGELGAFALVGQDAAVRRTFNLKADLAAFTAAGQDAGVRQALRLVADGTSYALAGQDANTLHGRNLKADLGTFDGVLQDATFRWQHILRADAQTYALAGTDTALRKASYSYMEAGQYSLQGYDSRPYFSNPPQAQDYTVRQPEMRGALRTLEPRLATRPAAVLPAQTTSTLRPQEDRTAEHQ